MKYIFVGDIHGKLDVMEEALSRDGMKIFVGDLVDSFDRSIEDQIKCVQLAVEAVKTGEAKVLFGNHELSYLVPSRHRASGFKAATATHLIHLKEDMRKHFQYLLEIESSDPNENNYLITHAGLHPTVMTEHDTFYRTTDEWIDDPDSSAHWVGESRGGLQPVGGIFWCDFDDEFMPIPHINQIFGHTRHGGRGIRTMHTLDSKNWCIDCLDSKTEFLELEID